jgi:hypothetical protein
LSEWQAILGVSDDVQPEPAVPARVLESSGRWPPDRQTTKDERPRIERQSLLGSVAILSDQLNGLDPLALPFRNEEV